MAESYIPQQIESKWQEKWEADKLYKAVIDPTMPKFYALTMLPYPSGDIHIGHWYAMAPSDVRARYKKMQGYNVLFPMGFDAFGLPAENAAIQRGIHPKTWTLRNIDRMRTQLKSMGAMFDWEREAVSCLPGYYRWTEWLFLKFYEMGLAYRKQSPVDYCPNCKTTLAREQVVGEERICERCGTPVVKKDLKQWFWRITNYADELLDFSEIDWPDKIRTLQTNWIGRSEGAEVVFKVAPEDMLAEAGAPGTGVPGEGDLVVFTTRPDTLWGATFMVLAPEHPLVDRITKPEQRNAIADYQTQATRQTEIERLSTEKEKTGVFTGAYAINPVNGERIPIWVADYVMMTYGTGAIMAVPAHDERDFAFAKKFELPIPVVIKTEDWDGEPLEEAQPGEGVMINSGPFDGTPAPHPAVEKVTSWLEDQGKGKAAVNYRLRDWLISRQRYWGAPIPMVYCDKCGAVPVPYEDLPVLLPDDVDFMPTGESPLKYHEEFLHTTCPKCGGPATRETDTMDTFVCSSWYHYAYLSPYYKDGEPLDTNSIPWDPEEAKYWTPVDTYTGGAEHATMHLIYTRFFTKALRDAGLVDYDEPMLQLRNQGIILGEPRLGDCVEITGEWDGATFRAQEVKVYSFKDQADWPSAGRSDNRVCGEVMDRDDVSLKVRVKEETEEVDEGALVVVQIKEGLPVIIPGKEGVGNLGDILYHLEVEKMSKSKKNVVAPDDLVTTYGADIVRAYLMFGWRWELGGPWDSQGIEGVVRWVHRVWNLIQEEPRDRVPVQPEDEDTLLRAMHRAVKAVTEDMENFSFNTAIARLMEYTNAITKARAALWGTAAWEQAIHTLLLLMAPITPHMTEELWAYLGKPYSIHQQSWPTWDEEMLVESTLEIPVQINGKVRGKITVSADADEETIKAAALAEPNVARHTEGKQIVKIIVPKGKLVSIVVKK
ncbi:MAG: leucine--tRNA ligase [Anaerolineae bacterium]|nr:leucine--tRNA ligase [Anaerolineae bacterium]